MSDQQTWPSQDFDAISITGRTGRIIIDGIEGDQVQLTSELEQESSGDLAPLGRWLQINLWRSASPADLTLRLPKNKAWVIEISAGRGRVEIKNIQARMQVMLGKGEIRIEDCSGMLDVMSGNGQVKVERCREVEMPDRPPILQSSPEGSMGGPSGPHSPRMKSKVPWDWWSWGEDDWTDWGLEIGEQATAWGLQFAQHAQNWARQFSHGFGSIGMMSEKEGISLQIGKGDVLMHDIQASGCTVGLGRGNLLLKGGLIEELSMMASHGNVNCQSVMPAGDWSIKATHGNIVLALPSNARAKLDVATRHGDIQSDIPLVRVARPGPESRHGGRMVGTVGQVEGKSGSWVPDMRARVRIKAGNWVMTDKDVKFGDHEGDETQVPEIDLETTNGDIKIELQGVKSQFAGDEKPSEEIKTARADRDEPSTSRSNEKRESPVEPTRAAAQATSESPATASTTRNQFAYNSHLAVLQALGAGDINVEEAEQLLRSMES